MYEVKGVDGRVALLPGHMTMVDAFRLVGRIQDVRRVS